MKLAVGQLEPSKDKAETLAEASRLCREAGESGAALLVLPELSLTGWSDSAAGMAALAEPLDGRLVTAVAELATEHGLTIVAGLYEPPEDEDPRPFNTLAVVAPDRGLIASHRKTHLYDAWGYRESDEARPGGGDLVVVEVEDTKVGIVNCYEVRFPERSRALVDAGAEVLAVSSAWANGPLKEEHWLLNLRARALENTVWVAGASLIGPEVTARSAIVDPLAMVRAELDERTAATATVDADRERLEQARKSLPVLAQRQAAYPGSASVPQSV